MQASNAYYHIPGGETVLYVNGYHVVFDTAAYDVVKAAGPWTRGGGSLITRTPQRRIGGVLLQFYGVKGRFTGNNMRKSDVKPMGRRKIYPSGTHNRRKYSGKDDICTVISHVQSGLAVELVVNKWICQYIPLKLTLKDGTLYTETLSLAGHIMKCIGQSIDFDGLHQRTESVKGNDYTLISSGGGYSFKRSKATKNIHLPGRRMIIRYWIGEDMPAELPEHCVDIGNGWIDIRIQLLSEREIDVDTIWTPARSTDLDTFYGSVNGETIDNLAYWMRWGGVTGTGGTSTRLYKGYQKAIDNGNLNSRFKWEQSGRTTISVAVPLRRRIETPIVDGWMCI